MTDGLLDLVIAATGGCALWKALRAVNLNLPSITLDIHDVELIHRTDEEVTS